MEKPGQFLGLSDHSRVIKRQRAHRTRRMPSPHGRTAVAASSSSSVGGDCSILEAVGQDEDMANCLILLAKGDGPVSSDDQEDPKEESGSEKSENTIGSMVRSKKVSEVGVVYECKTCNRVFPSFQALGGHRASHSKPNKGTGMLEDQNRTKDHDQDQGQIHRNNLSPHSAPIPEAISLGAKPGKVHECSICGSEFASGQALGGHMRRHRSSANGDDFVGVSSRADDPRRKPRKLPSLDLNLPAPEDDDNKDSMFGYVPGQPVQPLIFSAGALVDCYY